jgi:amidase
MKRRTFLELAALGWAGAAIGASMDQSDPDQNSNSMRRPHSDSESRAPRRPFKLEEAVIPELREDLSSGRESAVSLVKKYLRRIEELDRSGPSVNSVIEINPDALAIARALDDERKRSRASGGRGPLHGIPVLLKDNIDTHDRMTTTAGSLALAGSIAPQDSFVAQKLREAGAVILGKTNLSEWANYRSTRSTSGWSGRGGLTKNPYALDRNTSGSSSGSAAAVAAGFCAVAVGTETDGSVVSPSSYCGIVGIKPTLGRISRAGIIPIAASQDTAGPMARTVTDAAILLGVLSGEDPRDPIRVVPRLDKMEWPEDYTKFLDADGLRGARIGVARRFFGTSPETDRVANAALELMRREGAILIDPADLPTHGQFGRAENLVLSYEFKSGLNAYLAALGPGAPVRTLKEIIEFNEKNWEREMPYFGQEIFLESEGRGPLTEKAYLDAVQTCRRLARAEGIDALMDRHQLDAIAAPTTGPAHKTDLVWGDRHTGGCSSPAAVAGYPHITVPAGEVMGLPMGISFFGRAWSEPVLIKLAFAFEQASMARKTPRFLKFSA